MIVYVKTHEQMQLPTTVDLNDTLKKFKGHYDEAKIMAKKHFKTHQKGYDYKMAKRRKENV